MINPEQLLAARIPEIEQRYGWRECVLYALGIGIGLDPMDEADLQFVDETRLKVHPSMANVLGYPGFWQRDPVFGLDWVKTVHGEHAIRIHRPLPHEAQVVGVSRVVDLVDKGEGKGALIYVEREIRDTQSSELLATVNQTVFCRGDGGFSGPRKAQPAPRPDETAVRLRSDRRACHGRSLLGAGLPRRNPAPGNLAGRRRPGDIPHHRAATWCGGHEQRTIRGGSLSNGILSNIRVLDLSRVLSGPWATQILGDFGADALHDVMNRKVTGKVVLTTGL